MVVPNSAVSVRVRDRALIVKGDERVRWSRTPHAEGARRSWSSRTPFWRTSRRAMYEAAREREGGCACDEHTRDQQRREDRDEA